MANVFFVTQGQTFDFECRDGYIWAPNPLSPELRIFLSKGKGDKVFWQNVELVKVDDVIIHHAGAINGGISAISRAITDCYSAPITDELFAISNMGIPGVGLWPPDGGRRVDCEYVELKKKMPIETFHDVIRRFKREKYSAFNRNCGVNQGYLYELEGPIAYSMIREAINLNPYLSGYEFITNILKTLGRN